jgi:oxaloacetate decarboxylase alpha subunit
MNEVHFVDTTLRDGQSSLWAYGMRTDMMLPVVATMDRAGFEAMEIIASAPFKKCVRELREDPWERLRLVRQRVQKTPLRAIRGRYMSAFHITPQAIEDLWSERLVANGIRQVRISDCSNMVTTWRRQADNARHLGLGTIINLIYSLSPKHTDAYYSQRARDAAALKPDRICIKDPGGLLTPERTRTLVPAVLKNTEGLPVEFHTHCNTGLGPLCCLEAIKLNIKSINTALPPLADGSSNPSLFNITKNARALGYVPAVDEKDLAGVTQHFTEIARHEGLPIGTPVAYDCEQYFHQVPGGMIANLRHQLSNMGLQDKLKHVLEETARVRAEFGHPIMVTPYSQFIGTQAVMNVVLGERYKAVSDEVIQYALGLWGYEESSSIESDVRDRILSMPRARELAGWRPDEPSLAEVRRKYGGAGVSDDDLLLRYFAGKEQVDAMRAAVPRRSDGAAYSVVDLIKELGKARRINHVHIQRGSLSLTLENRAAGSQE